MAELLIASRSSTLALAQFAEFERSFPGLPLKATLFGSPGDRDKITSLLHPEIPGDFFTRDLDEAVLSGIVDAALHSAKDLAWPLPQGLEVWYLGPRADSRDSLVSHQGFTLETLPPGSKVGTSSLARKAQLLSQRPDLEIVSVRGTIEERIGQARNLSGVIVAQCALDRLGITGASPLAFDTHPLQGHLALVGKLHHRNKYLFSDQDERRHYGPVSICGAGPGRRDLLSLGALKRIEHADIIFHDALLDLEILGSSKAELVYVGKRKGRHELNQDGINLKLYQEALKGKRVLRLKGGDPLILGRGSEETAYLSQRLIRYEIIPGVSAAQTAAAFAEIPLTERGKGSSFSLSSGYPADKIVWTNADTQAFYMAGSALEVLAKKAAEHGKAKQTLLAIHGAGSPLQKIHSCSLEEAPNHPGFAQENSVSPAPVLYMTGATVDLRAGNGWFDRLPLVLYTGISLPEQADSLVERAVHIPFIEVKNLGFQELSIEAQQAIQNPSPYDWIVFTSPQTVTAWFGLWSELGKDSRWFNNNLIAAIGQSTARALARYGIRADMYPDTSSEHSQGLAEVLKLWLVKNARSLPYRLLLPRSDQALEILPERLSEHGFLVEKAVLYRTTAILTDAGNLENYHELVLSSPSAVESFKIRYKNIPQNLKVRLRGPQSLTAFQKAWPDHPDAQVSGGVP